MISNYVSMTKWHHLKLLTFEKSQHTWVLSSYTHSLGSDPLYTMFYEVFC